MKSRFFGRNELGGRTPRSCAYNNPHFRGDSWIFDRCSARSKTSIGRTPQVRGLLLSRGERRVRRSPPARSIWGEQSTKLKLNKGVGGAGTGACSGDLLLGALAACAQITCQMVAAAMAISTEAINVTVEGDLDLQGTLGLSKGVPVGFQNIRIVFDIRAPQATEEQLRALQAKTEQYCVVMQTLQHPPKIESKWQQ